MSVKESDLSLATDNKLEGDVSVAPLLVFLLWVQGTEAIYVLAEGLEGLPKSVNNILEEYVSDLCK